FTRQTEKLVPRGALHQLGVQCRHGRSPQRAVRIPLLSKRRTGMIRVAGNSFDVCIAVGANTALHSVEMVIAQSQFHAHPRPRSPDCPSLPREEPLVDADKLVRPLRREVEWSIENRKCAPCQKWAKISIELHFSLERCAVQVYIF